MEQNKNNNLSEPSVRDTGKQEQSDPQITELRGYVNPEEDLEPTLTDGTKAPDKAKEEHTQKNND